MCCSVKLLLFYILSVGVCFSASVPESGGEQLSCFPRDDLTVLSIKGMPLFLCTSAERSFVLAASLPLNKIPIKITVDHATLSKLDKAYIEQPEPGLAKH